MNTINWQPKALKQARKLPKQDQVAISRAVSSELVDLSKARNVKKLTNHEFSYRLRVGNYPGVFRVRRCDPHRHHRGSEEAR